MPATFSIDPADLEGMRSPSGESGFALADLIAALAVLSLATAAVLPGVSSALRTASLEHAAMHAVTKLRQERNAAFLAGEARAVGVDTLGGRLVFYATGDTLDLAGHATFAGSERAPSAIVFLPDGRSTGGSLLLTRRSGGYRIDVGRAGSDVTIVRPVADARQ